MSAARAAIQAAKRLVLPGGRGFRRVLWGPAAGCWLWLDLHHELRLYFGIYERELGPSFRRLLRPGMKSFDIGGRDGYTALAIAARTGADVLSFESDPQAAASMRQVFERNAHPVRAVNAFVGANDGDSSITVDRAAGEYFVPDFIKVDVEGGEADVLAGAAHTLEGRRPALIVEVHGTGSEAACREILARHRYGVEAVDRARWFAEHRPLAHNRWLACVPRA